MKIDHAQQRPPSKGTGLGPSLLNLATTTLAVSCTFFAFGCGERPPTSKVPATTPPPVTAAPVLTPPNTSSSDTEAPRPEKSSEPPTPTGRVAEDATPVQDPIDARSHRVNHEGDFTAAGGEATGVSQAVPSSNTARSQRLSSSPDEEDVSAALRREVAEMERQRAR